jgi:two-component system response regulator ChvI
MYIDLLVLFIVVQEISFTGHSQNSCVCFVDIVDSTRVTVQITNPDKLKRYYSIFINMMAAIARDHGANIIKNTGDSLIYYFPEASDSAKLSAFKDVLNCGLTMILVNPIVNAKLSDNGLPPLRYRISADYGRVELAKSLTSTAEDLFGPTVNICAKINPMALPNNMVIGSDLYEIVKSNYSKSYYFKKIGEYSIEDLGIQYPVYSVSSKDSNRNNNIDALNLYKNIV